MKQESSAGARAIHFKVDYTVRGLRVAPGKVFRFDYGGPYEVSVEIGQRLGPGYEGSEGEMGSCVATCCREPTPKVEEVFRRIASNQMISEEDSEARVGLEYPAHDGVRIRVPFWSQLPEPFRYFLDSTLMELNDFAHRTYSVLCWRRSHLGPHRPFSSRGMWWSFDGLSWHVAPVNVTAHLSSVEYGFYVSEATCEQVTTYVRAGGGEPLPHDLYREAWEQRFTKPRSALVIGIASAEIATKQCIAKLVPDAEWLAINSPTPPLVKMLTEFLPLLPARVTLGGKVKAPPDEILRTLRKGVNLRNQVSHAGTAEPSAVEVEEILRAVRDVLWLLDFYAGHEWAIGFLSEESKAALGAGTAGSPKG